MGKLICLLFKDQLGETFFNNSNIALIYKCVFNKDFQYLISSRDK